MKTIIRIVLLLALLSFGCESLSQDLQDIPQYLENISVTVKTPDSIGSGVVFTRKDSTGTNDITFVWSAGHIVSDKEEIIVNFTIPLIVTNAPVLIKEVSILQPVIEDGRLIKYNSMVADVIKISDNDGEDLSIMRIRGKFYNTNTTNFYYGKKIPKMGTQFDTIGSPDNEKGSFSTGVCSFVGRVFEGRVFDQTTLVVYPGSSGGGVFLASNGQCVGITTIMSAPSINYMVPIRRMISWAKRENVEWALNPNVPIPTEKELKLLPLMDTTHVYTNSINSIIIK